VIARGATREEALARLRRALRELRIGGIATNTAFLLAVLDDPSFRRAEHDVTLVPHLVEQLYGLPAAS
jgi:acetyl-CoA carboxylase biotin carboxylase subunit